METLAVHAMYAHQRFKQPELNSLRWTRCALCGYSQASNISELYVHLFQQHQLIFDRYNMEMSVSSTPELRQGESQSSQVCLAYIRFFCEEVDK